MTTPHVTQVARIRTMLEGNDGLCAMAPLDWNPPIVRVAARINDLREMGWVIETIHKCPLHFKPRQHAYYRLMEEPY
jgi:hypothetical protein